MRMPDLSRRQVMAIVAIIAGLVAITLALIGGSGSSGSGGPDRSRSIDPVAPLDPNDKNPGKFTGEDPLAGAGDPFSSSFGAKGPRKITVRVSGNGPLGVGIRYRGGHKTVRVVSRAYSVTRTVKGGSPSAIVGIRLGPHTNHGSCSILVDGVKVASRSIGDPFGVTTCVG